MTTADFARWEARWCARAGPVGGPESFLVEEAASLPAGPVLDVAAGDGRNALWLARRGFSVAAVDIAPAAIARLRAAAREQGLSIATRVADLDEPHALADLGPFASLVVMRFKPSPAQWATLRVVLAPGGRVCLCSFRAAHHAANGFPLAYCLDRAELVAILASQFRLLRWREVDAGRDLLAASVWERPDLTPGPIA